MRIASAACVMAVFGGVLLWRPWETRPVVPHFVAPAGGTAPEVAALPRPAPSPAAGGTAPATNLPQRPSDPFSESIEELRDAARSHDAERMKQASKAIEDWLGGSAGRALALVDTLRGEDDVAVQGMLAAILAGDPAIARSEAVIRAMLDLARTGRSPDRRRAALLFLADGGARSPDVEREVAQVMRDDADPVVCAAAIGVLRAIASDDAAAAGRLNPQLLAQAAGADDAGVRVSAVQAVQAGAATEEQLRAIGGRLTGDADPNVRLVAVGKLAEAAPAARPLALQLLQEGYARNTDAQVKGACLTALVRFGGKDSLAVLSRLHEADPRLAQDISDYVSILSGGETDWERIAAEKLRLEQSRRK